MLLLTCLRLTTMEIYVFLSVFASVFNSLAFFSVFVFVAEILNLFISDNEAAEN